MSQFVLLLTLAAGVAAAEPADSVTVRGRVLDPDGKPVQGARLYSLRLPKTQLKSEEDIEFSQRAKSDAQGRFRFELPRSDIHPQVPMPVLAAADGYGVGWTELSQTEAPAELTLRLVQDQSIEGRILSTEGKPLAGVHVRAFTANKMSLRKWDDFLLAWKRDWQKAAQESQKPPEAMLLPRDEKCSQAVTDKDGRFRIQGAGAERLVWLRLHGPGIVPAVLFVFNRAGFNAASVNKVVRDRTVSQERRLSPPPLLYGPAFDHVAMAGRRIEGAVREIGNGKRLAGFHIRASVAYDYEISAESDKDGHYELVGVPKMKHQLLIASPPENSSWLQTSAVLNDATGTQPLRVDFTVARGVGVSGRVIDKTTGKGVPGLVRFVALPGNSFFDNPGHAAYRGEHLGIWTDAAGSFQLAVFPGPGVLMARASVTEKVSGYQLSPYKQAEFDAQDRARVKVAQSENGIRSFPTIDKTVEVLDAEHAVKVLDLAADAGTAKCNLFVDRGATRTLRIEDAAGKPLMGTLAAGMTADLGSVIPVRDALGIVLALDPKKPRRLFFLHVQRNLAGSLLLRGDEKEPVIVRLKRAGAVTGRLLDADGQPLAGADVNPIGSEAASIALYQLAQRPPVRTDKGGRFRIEGIVPEVKFTLGFTRGRTYFRAEPSFGFKQVKAGETLDLGEIRIKPAG